MSNPDGDSLLINLTLEVRKFLYQLLGPSQSRVYDDAVVPKRRVQLLEHQGARASPPNWAVPSNTGSPPHQLVAYRTYVHGPLQAVCHRLARPTRTTQALRVQGGPPREPSRQY